MPTVASLERLQAIVTKLTPLARVQRGTLIRAQDWNELVTAVLDVARSILAEDRLTDVPPHQHADQVSLEWLSPSLRQLIERGPLADPVPLGRLGTVERDLQRARDRVHDVEGRLGDLRARLSDVATRHATRDSELADLHRIVGGLTGGGAAVDELRSSLRAIRTDVEAALDLGRRLTMGGQPPDLEALNRRLAALEELRSILTLPTGEVLDAPTIERRLVGLDSRFATKEELREVASREPIVPAGELAAVEGRLQARLREDVERVSALALENAGRATAEALAGVDARVSTAVSDALPGLSETLLARTRAETTESVRAGVDRAVAAANDRLALTEKALREALDSGLADLGSSISGRVRAELDRELPARFTDLTARVSTVSSRLDGAATRLDAAETRLSGNESQIVALSRGEAAARADLNRTLIAEMDRRDALQAETFNARLTAFRGDLDSRMTEALTAARRTILDDARRTATEAAVTEARLVQTTLRAEMRAIARDEVTVFNRDRVVGTPILRPLGPAGEAPR